MSEIFLKIINMSISASYIVLAVLLLRLLLKKAPKRITVVLWGIVAIRLLCPFSIESVLSLIPSAQTVSPDIMLDRTPEINTGIPMVNQVINPVISGSFTPNPETSANPLQLWIPTFAVIWIVGMVALLIYTVISYQKVRRKIGTAVLLRDNIYQSENVISPFVLGIIKPKIYLPFNMNEKNMGHVVAHEMAHIRRKDHLWKPLGFLLLTLHWFNPLMWLGYVLLCRDIELACDEKVVKELDYDARADYSQALLTCSVNRQMLAACPLAFGEVGVKDRVKSALNYKKPKFWIIIAAVAACVAVAVCFLTNPQKKVKDLLVPKTSWECESYDLTFQMDQNYIIEGDINTPNYSGKISVGFRYAGKKAVAEIFKGDWEYAQSAAEEPLLSGTFHAEGNKLMFEIKEDNLGVDQKELIFCQTELSGANLASSNEIFTDYDGVYVSIKSIGTNTGGHTVFNLVWHNTTNEDITYGESYIIERKEGNDWVNTASEELYSTAIGLLLRPNSTANKSYSTQRFDISQSGIYRLRVTFFVDEGDGYKKYNTWIEFKVGLIPTTDYLREQYPEYFGLDSSEGLDVYVWQMAENHYSFGVLSHSEQMRDWLSDDLMNLKGVSVENMREILATYDIDEDDIYVMPWQNPISSYIGGYWIITEGEDIDAKRNAYVEGIRAMLFETVPKPSFMYAFLLDDGRQICVNIQDLGCDVKDATINFEKARFEDGKLIFDIHWTNEGSANIDIGPDFEVYKYNGSTPEKLEQLGYWHLYREMLAGKGMTADDGFVFEYQRAKSYNLSAHYDVLSPGKYRFEAHGAWVEFQIINDFSDFSVVYDTATFDVDGDGKEENCSLQHGRTSGVFTFIFLVQDKETNEVEYETVIRSQWYDLSFQKGADGVTKVQGITQGDDPEPHLFDISIKDGYVSLTENGVYIGEIIN